MRSGIRRVRQHASAPELAYCHGGITVSTSPFSCPWDSGQIGVVLASKEEWPDELDAKKAATAHVKWWDQYLTGDVWHYRILDGFGDELDSLYGIYGHDEAEKEAQSMVEHFKHGETEEEGAKEGEGAAEAEEA